MSHWLDDPSWNRNEEFLHFMTATVLDDVDRVDHNPHRMVCFTNWPCRTSQDVEEQVAQNVLSGLLGVPESSPARNFPRTIGAILDSQKSPVPERIRRAPSIKEHSASDDMDLSDDALSRAWSPCDVQGPWSGIRPKLPRAPPPLPPTASRGQDWRTVAPPTEPSRTTLPTL